MNSSSQSLLSSLTHAQWQRIGIQRRAGVAVPLFSLYSSSSLGIGEFPDLKLLIDWCKLTGMSMIQLLPLNDVGFTFTPYDAQSMFALDPMYLSLSYLAGVDKKLFQDDLTELKQKFPAGEKRVNYEIKGAKLELLWKIFRKKKPASPSAFERFKKENQFWLRDYCLFKVLKEKNHESAWESWPEDLKHRNENSLNQVIRENEEQIFFYEWLQWQACIQFKKVKQYARAEQVFLMGDLPFLVSRDSADVWARQSYFKLNLASGAPPDFYFAHGQRWGMPPYDWQQIASHDFDYVKERLRYAQNFYDAFRIDHTVGIFRLWTIALSEPLESAGLKGIFDPSDETKWEDHGRWLLDVLVKNTSMLPCAEDLGVVPKCSEPVLQEFGIPGMDVQRWKKEWVTTCDFTSPDQYRLNSIAVLSTHDSASLRGWWDFEAGTTDELLFKRHCEEHQLNFPSLRDQCFDLSKSFHGRLRWKEEIADVSQLLSIFKLDEKQAAPFVELYKGTYKEKEKFWNYLGLTGIPDEKLSSLLAEKILKKISQANSIFSIQLLQDWLSLDEGMYSTDAWNYRINFPGTVGLHNWSVLSPYSLDQMLELKINSQIQSINSSANRG